jgi:hypothetical protein
MFQLLPSELKIVEGWAESALHRHGIPLPEEEDILNKIKKAGGFRSVAFEDHELEIVLIWADEGVRGRYSPGKFILEPEKNLIDKIRQYMLR